MNAPRRVTIFDLVAHFGLKIEYVHDQHDDWAGRLYPEDSPRFIMVNANHPPFEQLFTIAHELTHFVRKHNKPRRLWPSLLHRRWSHPAIALWARLTRLAVAKKFDREWEADLGAMLFLLYLGNGMELQQYVKCHSEKSWWLLYCLAVLLLFNFKRRMSKALKRFATSELCIV